jgi:hypothetical protein
MATQIEAKKGIGWKPPVEISLECGEKITVMPYMSPPAFYCLKEAINPQTKKFDDNLFTPQVMSYFLKCMVVSPPFTDETFKNSDMVVLHELVRKIMESCNLPKEVVENLKSPPTKP